MSLDTLPIVTEEVSNRIFSEMYSDKKLFEKRIATILGTNPLIYVTIENLSKIPTYNKDQHLILKYSVGATYLSLEDQLKQDNKRLRKSDSLPTITGSVCKDFAKEMMKENSDKKIQDVWDTNPYAYAATARFAVTRMADVDRAIVLSKYAMGSTYLLLEKQLETNKIKAHFENTPQILH